MSEVPSCYRIGENGFCIGLWSNEWWSHRKCRFCPLFPIEWCGTCRWLGFSGPHAFCGHPKYKGQYHGWLPIKDSGYTTCKGKVGNKSACPDYERKQ